MLRRVLITTAGVAAASVATYAYVVRPWWRSWGVDAAESARPLPGDDLVPEAPISETRAITIDAPPEYVWPWLPQMGFGRAGWYSYDQLDMAGGSSDRILPEFQDLKVGDRVPTDPRGGFAVKLLDSGRALVLYLDREMVAEFQAPGESVGSGDGVEPSPANLRATGAFLGAATPPEFKVSWAMVVEPIGATQSRLLVRFRAMWTPAEGEGVPPVAVQQAMQPLMSFGIFVMTRKQLLGIRERAERIYQEGWQPAAPVAPSPAPQPVGA